MFSFVKSFLKLKTRLIKNQENAGRDICVESWVERKARPNSKNKLHGYFFIKYKRSPTSQVYVK